MRPRRIVWRFGLIDALMTLALFAVMVSALFRWPDKILADVAFPIAALIAFELSRER